jgi:orotate phosphoribosyltransferase
LFVDVARISPALDALAERLRPYDVSVVCGPLLGGAFLAQAMAARLGVRFCYTVPGRPSAAPGLFTATYVLPSGLIPHVRAQRIAIVDDAVSAGSSAKATKDALDQAGATTVVVGALLTLGTSAIDHFAQQDIRIEAIEHRPFDMWGPDECPLCVAGEPVDPRSEQ